MGEDWTREPKGLLSVIQKIRAQGGPAEAWEADLPDLKNIQELFDRAEEAFGPVEVLVNNAAHREADTFLPSEFRSSTTGAC